jgi:hypothetical protein
MLGNELEEVEESGRGGIEDQKKREREREKEKEGKRESFKVNKEKFSKKMG